MRTAQTIEASNSDKTSPHSTPANTRKKAKLTPEMEIRKWKPGQSGNPAGRKKNDIAAEIAQAIFENNKELIYQAYAKALKAGNAYAYQVIADRGFGKLTEKKEITRTYQDVPTSDLQRRMDELIRDLGLQRRVDAVTADPGNTSGTGLQDKPREAADVLPR